MITPESLKDHILTAFSKTPYPGSKNLRGSDQGDEPFMVERDFWG